MDHRVQLRSVQCSSLNHVLIHIVCNYYFLIHFFFENTANGLKLDQHYFMHRSIICHTRIYTNVNKVQQCVVLKLIYLHGFYAFIHYSFHFHCHWDFYVQLSTLKNTLSNISCWDFIYNLLLTNLLLNTISYQIIWQIM